jgi:Oxidoreductase family, NAD-binding Rossmann fold
VSARRVLVIGSGKRVQETALPAFTSMSSGCELAGIRARTKKRIECKDACFDVDAFDELREQDLEHVDLVYVAVGKSSVPEVLERLTQLGPERFDLLIDTPVLPLRQFRHVPLLDRFRTTWVAEDCIELPWIEPVRLAIAHGELGEVREARFLRSAYGYHGVALAKKLFAADVTSATRKVKAHATIERRLHLSGGKRVLITEPRDYASGHLVVVGSTGRLSDAPEREAKAMPLLPLLEHNECVGFRAGSGTSWLDEDETLLMLGDDPGTRVTARMAGMKRVGFLRLLRSIAQGRGGYPVREGLDDMLIDYALEKCGRWVATPFTSVRSAPARMLFTGLSRFAGGSA